ncbi:hypothetical protein SEA_ZENTENO07_101 [Mycobacterium phage Zenteno07]|nr:hypothetical protein SEA_ZENTENO07_101 [Mycobacterium phage Zenteno07]
MAYQQDQPQTYLGGVDYSGIPGSELRRVIADPYIPGQGISAAEIGGE